LIVAFALYRRWNGAVCTAACTIVALLVIANHMVMPGVDAYISARPAAAGLIKTFKLKPDEVAVYRLPRAYGYGLNYYFDANLAEWTPQNQNAKGLFCSREALESPLLSGTRRQDEILATGDGKILFVILRREAEK
jgi:hypothetical protein